MRRCLSIVVVLSVVLLASARPLYRNEIPNGKASERPGSGITCKYLGHQDCEAGTPRNQFGNDFEEAGLKWTKEFCEKDSDGDGLTNGEELGDPCCIWTPGKDNILRKNMLSHPGVKAEDGAKDAPKCQATQSPTTSAQPTPTKSRPTRSPTTSPTNSPTKSPTVSPSPSRNASSDEVCFPQDATVRLQDGRILQMHELNVGHLVQVAPHQYSPIFMFTHRVPTISYTFVRLRTAKGFTIRLTASHFIYANSRLVPASHVSVGQTLSLVDGADVVVSVDSVNAKGLYNPQTLHGDIMVDGVRVSTYTKALSYRASHSALTPFRVLFSLFGITTASFERGVRQSVFECTSRLLQNA